MTSKTAMRVVSGIQPTGDLHLGNLLGAILRWVRMQDEAQCLFFLADLHALTVDIDPAELGANVREMAAALIRFANGAIGKVGCTLEGNVKYTFNVRLHGDRGTLVNNRFRTTFLDPGLEGWAEFPTILPDTPEVTHHPFPGEIDDLVDAILHDKQPLLNIQEDAKTYEIAFAAEQSAREGKPIKLPLPR